jgi:hypothetical protein
MESNTQSSFNSVQGSELYRRIELKLLRSGSNRGSSLLQSCYKHIQARPGQQWAQ